MNKQTLGEIAYNAYCTKREWKSFSGEPLPPFNGQSLDLQEAWNIAAEAVKAEVYRIDNIPKVP
jgi:hypothetical protein